jgi:hypothetical protein
MDDIPIFILLGSGGIIITIILCITGERNKTQEKIDTDFDYIHIFKISISIVALIYLFRLIMMFFTGMISDFIIPSLVGLILAVIPIVMIILLGFGRTNGLKV